VNDAEHRIDPEEAVGGELEAKRLDWRRPCFVQRSRCRNAVMTAF
jgi:hypothetical protein